ncbi:hypothetical protein PGUG_02644 [Meyerozyma guilliermondii ATCC 6260]|uniref:WH1 domain-containing protein n=1 Tax=Meyerozyma guilliermondii (strain ATCC 6260 / CBS 566 / DSM 6381 / JCM 1539 / NBRC 10279 / NRRL Y-324) TaxID=294746 RepID=A5DH93_PICGU|nr:uncharacterized protein PGUG_02644 [Meyerozyma guilliermondii ATCC 6260]EDK38546.2 hypothetical protein PGUG_02644 [Meyerozyma guilliermondii ATCC 6260]
MGLLTAADKEKIKRVIPKANNKIIDATVARLYIAHPSPTEWTYTGLVGAIVLVDDLVGHTYFLKMVDILGHRGVVWDQELWVNFAYHQDRKFFHTFEIEDCLVGLLFEDTSEASHFYKRVTSRNKHGSKHTVNNKSAIALRDRVHSDGRRQQPGPRGEFMDVNTAQRSRRAKGILYYDDAPPPEWRSLYHELEAAGITEDMIYDNREFIKNYIAESGGPLVGLEPPVPRRFQRKHEAGTTAAAPAAPVEAPRKHKKAPPPPPPPAANTSSDSASAFGSKIPSPASSPSPSPSPSPAVSTPTETPEPQPTPQSRFRLPPKDAIVPPVRNSSLPPPPSVTPQGTGPPSFQSNNRPLPGLPSQNAAPTYQNGVNTHMLRHLLVNRGERSSTAAVAFPGHSSCSSSFSRKRASASSKSSRLSGPTTDWRSSSTSSSKNKQIRSPTSAPTSTRSNTTAYGYWPQFTTNLPAKSTPNLSTHFCSPTTSEQLSSTSSSSASLTTSPSTTSTTSSSSSSSSICHSTSTSSSVWRSSSTSITSCRTAVWWPSSSTSSTRFVFF